MPPRDEFLSPAFYRLLLFDGIRILFILLFAYLATVIAGRIFQWTRSYAVKVMLKTQSGNELEIEKRARTVGDVVRKSIVSVIWVVAAIMILQELHFDVRPLLAGAGVVGLAIGFGAQSLVKDVLAGFFLLLENQIRVNDVVVVNGTGGLVEEINLRTTVLRGEDGAVHVFPNGNITKLANLTRDFSYAVFSISVDYKENTDHVVEVLNQIGAGLMNEDPYKSMLLAPLEMMGVDQLGESAVILKARFKTVPMSQWTIGREMNRRIKMKFQDAGINMPFPARTVLLLEADMGSRREEDLKRIVREVLKEAAAS